MAVTGGRDNRGSMDSEKLGLRASKQWQSTGGWDPGTSMVVRYGKSSKNMWMAERAQQSLGTAAGDDVGALDTAPAMTGALWTRRR